MKFTSERWIFVGLALVLSIALFTDAIARINHSGPEIVVYMDKDAKQPAILPLPATTTLTNERAALWWTVFNKACDKESYSDAKYTASHAVETVYGKVK